jgi:YegS/Rv2252/BmrU family lipid kinase
VRGPIKIIANPVSGRGRARRVARAVVDRLRQQGCEVELQETRQAGDARRHAADVRGFAAVACIGGDGTVNEVLNGLPAEGAPPLAMIPTGTANVLAKELRLPRRVDGLARVLTEGREVRWDLAVDRISGRRFLLFGSAGYDAHVVHVFHAARKGPIQMWQYIWWGLKSLLDYEVPRITVELDGRRLPGEAAWVQVSNVSSYGGPLVFTPRARPDDEALEVMVQHARRPRDILRMFWAALLKYFLGIELRLVDVTFHRARRVKLTSPGGGAVPVQVDGDPAGHLPADFELVPGGIRVLAP